jgi:hypothetical protein
MIKIKKKLQIKKNQINYVNLFTQNIHHKSKIRTCVFLKQNITNNVLHTLKATPILVGDVDNN